MKILFWTDGFWPRTGGIETQAFQFIQGMQQRGHEYLVFAQKDSPLHQEQEIHEGIAIRRFDFGRVQKDLRLLRTLREELQTFAPDAIHLYAGSGLSVFVFLLLKTLFRAPITLTLHAPFFYNGPNPILSQLVTMATQVCCVSQWVLDQTKLLVPSAAHKLKLSYNGLPLPQLTPSPLPACTFLLLGRLAPEKGFDTAIRAFALLRKNHPDARLIVAGGGPERSFLESLGLEHGVQFTGEFSREEAFYWINQASTVIVPSYFEPFGLVALEAMLMKRPVIASSVGGLPEIVLDGETGLLVPPRDPEALCKAMQDLIGDPEKAIAMGQNGYKRAAEQFRLEKNLASSPSFVLL